MRRKITIWFLILATAVIILPPTGNAKPTAERNNVNTYEYSAEGASFQRRRRRGRSWNRRWNRNRNRSWNRYRSNRGRYISSRNRRYRVVRQTYWRNGRRYVRYVRVY